LQFGSCASASAGAKIVKPAGNLAPPFRLNSQVAFNRGDSPARNGRMSEVAQRGVTKAANIRRIAVDGAALLTGFYHRSVLRCGRLAERKSGVADILSASRASENIFVGLSRIEYSRQPGARKSQSKRTVNDFQILASD